jgi:hypothetical protein
MSIGSGNIAAAAAVCVYMREAAVPEAVKESYEHILG